MSINKVIINGLVYRKDCKILFDPISNAVFKLDEIATEIVDGMTEGRTANDVAKLMSDKYNVDQQVIRKDIEDFWDSIFEADVCSDISEQEKDLQNLPVFPFSLEIALTKVCDLRCSFCHDAVLSSGGSHVHMPLKTVKSMLGLYADAGLMRIRYSGGEPTLHPNFEEILAYGKQLELYQIVFTNGQHVTEKSIEYWKEMNVGEVLISLHGSEEIHDALTRKSGSHHKAVNAIILALSSGISVVVEMTLVQQNYQKIFDTIDAVKELGVNQFRIMRYVDRGKNDNIFSVSFNELRLLIGKIEQRYNKKNISIRFPCSQKFCLIDECSPYVTDFNSSVQKKYLVQNCFAGLTWASISHSGELRICPHSSKAIANVFDDPQVITKLWSTVMRGQVLRVLDQRADKCSGCKAWSNCLGGCYLSDLE
ncbi:MAG: PqqD family peptide modification chaperone [Candidatus Pacebacteria bacterium]|nr:PqqD family peptide modification chaperone [Candidatus Paceibacterota bacterium]